MQMTLFTDYSMRALIYLSSHKGRSCTVKDISGTFGISRNHMVKVVRNLVCLGYIASAKGKNGGVRLAKLPEEINFHKLFMELEPHFNLVECFNREHNTCQIVSICGLKNILHEALASFLRTLEKYTLADAIVNAPAFINITSISQVRK